MALAPWDLVSWHSETGSVSEQAGPGVRRESYLKATRTSSNSAAGFDSRRQSGACSLGMGTPDKANYLWQARSHENSRNKLNGISADADSQSRISEIFQTPSGDVSVYVTDYSQNELVPNGLASADKSAEELQPEYNPPNIGLAVEKESEQSGSTTTPEASDDEMPPKLPVRKEREPYLSRDVAVLCIVFIFAFSAVRAVQVLQSSVNERGKLGILALSFFYLSVAITVVFFPPLINYRLSDRLLLCFGVTLLFGWLIANIMPHPLILLPGAIFGGAGLTLAWNAQMSAFSSYFSHSEKDSPLTRPADGRFSLRRFLLTNNTLFALFQSSHIWGNLSVAIILMVTSRHNAPTSFPKSVKALEVTSAANRSLVYNMTLGPGWYFLPPLFGSDVLPSTVNKLETLWSHCPKDATSLPSFQSWVTICQLNAFNFLQTPVVWAMAWLAGLACFALLMAVALFHPLPIERPDSNDEDEESDVSGRVQRFMVAHMMQMFDGPHFRLLIPLLFFNGLEQGFLYTDYTKIFVSCMFGLGSVGVAVMVAGVMSCIFSAAATLAAKRSVTREVMISVAAIVHLGLALFLYQWSAYPSIPIAIIIIPVIYGFCDAVWQTSCYVLITKVAGNEHRLAFSNFRILQSLGIAISCLLSFFAGLGLKVSVLVVNLLLAVLCYAILENRIRREELAAKDHQRMASAFKQLTMVMGAAGIHPPQLPRRKPEDAAAALMKGAGFRGMGQQHSRTEANRTSSSREKPRPKPIHPHYATALGMNDLYGDSDAASEDQDMRGVVLEDTF